ncbi:MAG: ribose-phosphate pyrophosphokinase [Gammaproteobacteria bacterium]|nr:ribose-phosphate pyrophosphokinase [Gammaproteobacteria bacterium]
MKKTPIIFPLFGYDDLVNKMNESLGVEVGKINLHQFPDEETVVTIHSNVSKRDVIFVASLDKPNTKILPLLFSADTARKLGASKIILISPYLAYMRQDKQFEPGQGITSDYFAKLISIYFDGLITVDPHLHRWHSLNDIYAIPTKILHETGGIAHWIKQNVINPILIGPDVESMQWVSEIAKKSEAPFLILTKTRKGDRSVEISIPNIERYQQSTPVLIDDIISTGVTMIETVRHLRSLNRKPVVCIAVHAVFANHAYQDLLQAGAGKIVTCNTIIHPSNTIDVTNLISDSIKEMIKVS